MLFTVQKDLSAGTHIHVSLAPAGRFSLEQLKHIAFTLIFNERIIHEILPQERRDSRFCKINTTASPYLKNCTVIDLGFLIIGQPNEEQLCQLMQGNERAVLWNFQNTRPQGSGTIEFRGGRHMRGPHRTLRWIAFAVSVIYMSLREVR
jgi:Putative amidoligase enzyme